MPLSNSFHSSAKKHAISGNGKLARVERHNSRGYFSFEYDQSKIHALIGEPTEIAGDVRQYIDATFAGAIDAYNAKQKRKDRMITDTPFEYFDSNKNLDIANEAIFQLGGQEFWSRHRIDTVIQTKKGERVIKSYPEEVKEVMDEIFRRQMDAYEKIYETDSQTILDRIQADKEASEAYIAVLPEPERLQYQDIMGEKDMRKRAKLIQELPDPDAYLEYAAAAEKLTMIDKLKLNERIQAGQMHIKVVNGTAHYDEYSPHAHGVSVCWTEGYKTGVNARVAKSVVLNQWSLSVLQDKLRDIAREEMSKHPDIFQGEILTEKRRGRNMDYSAEHIARQKQQHLQKQIQEGETLVNEIAESAEMKLNEYRQNAAKSESLQAEVARLEENKNLIQSYEEYDYEVGAIDEKIEGWAEELEDILDVAQQSRTPAPVIERLLRGVLQIMEDAADALRRRIERIHIFEQIHDILFPNAKRLNANLDDVIAGAESGQKAVLQQRQDSRSQPTDPGDR